MERADLVIGIDFGTDSVRAVVVNAADGREEAAAVCDYPRWKQGLYSDPAANQFRHHPLDYIESMEAAVKGAWRNCPCAGERVAGSLIPPGQHRVPSTEGRPLALGRFAANPNAMFVLEGPHRGPETEELIITPGIGAKRFHRLRGGIYSSNGLGKDHAYLPQRPAGSKPPIPGLNFVTVPPC